MPTEPTAPLESSNPSQTQASPFSVPKIELPKGGGAIRGIEEKFTANPATGTGKMTIPLGLSPGRSGFTPGLALAYDSGSGNGPFGVGWSISLPTVTRKTDKGLPTYRPLELAESDVFVLSGAEDLVPVLVRDETGDAVDEEFQSGEYRVKRYRPRIETLFARIERWTRIEDGDEHWRSIGRDNTLTVYGRDQRSRIFDPDHPDHVFSWLISESYDDRGNAILYEYVAEDDRGVDLSLASENRRVRNANRYLKRVRYGNRLPLLIDSKVEGFRRSHLPCPDVEHAAWMFEMVFDYGEESFAVDESEGKSWAEYRPEQASEWALRRDPFSRYRSRFEVRCYRLCRRVLMIHHFPQELSVDHCLVRSTEFEYREKASGSFITRFTQSGYVPREQGRYLRRSMPSVEVDYTISPLDDGRWRNLKLKQIEASSLENLPVGIDEKNYRWIDLNGEGISGVLSEQGREWFYKPNRGGGRLGAAEVVAQKPSLAELNRGRQQLLDVAGDGTLNLVDFEPTRAGFYERKNEGGWGWFRTFSCLPVMDWNDPNMRFVDVTGDGIADILITEDDALLWHASLLDEGFGPATRVSVPSNEQDGPHVLFADGVESIYLADMSGDGLSDLVRIRNGEVCYWPNLGYGVFGPKVAMDNAPWFADEDLFEQSRVRLADTDGSGPVDIVYLGSDSIRIYLNESGNGWSEARSLEQFAPVTVASNVSVIDLLGRGTACLVWSSQLPADLGRSLSYVDLMEGEKPHLLVSIRNNVGAETRIEYATSTEFYLADQSAGEPWITRLPFPVHVVKRVETFDFISRNRFLTSYSYHHGFFDGLEREFRGFGRVDQLDTEHFEVLSTPGVFPIGENIANQSSIPPVLTKTWFHTGVFLGNGRVSRHLAHEYYREPISNWEGNREDPLRPMLLEDTILPSGLNAEEAREACRALKGSMLRQEIYALDQREESSRPYTVTESNSSIVTLQRRGPNLHAVFFVHPCELANFNYERKLYIAPDGTHADPRVTHSAALELDRFGNVLRSISIGYGRRFEDTSSLLGEEDRAKQRKLWATYADYRFTNAIEEANSFRTPLPAETRVYELVGLGPKVDHPGITNLFRVGELKDQIAQASDGTHDLPFEDFDALGARKGACYQRLIGHTRTYYRADHLDRILPLSMTGTLGLPGRAYKLASTSDLLRRIFRADGGGEELVPDLARVLEKEGRYVELAGGGGWWIPTGRIYYLPSEREPEEELEAACRHFFLPRRFVDPFDNPTIVTYDLHDLEPVEVRNAMGNTVTSAIDYRVLSPFRITDENRNRSQVVFDALGLVVGTAIMGKHNEHVGDSLDGFEADLDEQIILEHLASPLLNPHAILNMATTRTVYDLFAYTRTRHWDRPQPAVSYTLARETHAADLPLGEQTKFQHVFSYSDGFGREIQKKTQAEPGLIDGVRVDPRWVGSGWTIFNNKGKPVREYEPFFTSSHAFEFANIVGVSPIVFYDPLGRVVLTLHPNHTYDKVVFDPWRQDTWDVNDTVLVANPARDPDVGDFFSKLNDSDYLPTWYTARVGDQRGKEEQRAAEKAALHANTPQIAFSDSLGRTFLKIAHNRFERDGAEQNQFLETRIELDVQNNQRFLLDALGRVAMRYDFDILGTRLCQRSQDAGSRWVLKDVLGKALLDWNSRGYRKRYEYDSLHRPTGLYVRGDSQEIQAERVVYGEGQHEDLALNLRGKAFRQFDAAGILTNGHYDFKGNLLKSTRQLLTEYRRGVDWSEPNELEPQVFRNTKTFDALNRTITMTAPDGSVTHPRYNPASLLESMAVRIRGNPEPTAIVTYITYNAKGQREMIDYGNGAHTLCTYDPLTFRMVRLETHRREDHDRLQDLVFTFDPIGNITSIRDKAQESIFFRNQVVSPSSEYGYDAIYRLISADGREHAGFDIESQLAEEDVPQKNFPLPSDGHALRRYCEHYHYDAVGNILELRHSSSERSWVLHYHYDGSDGHSPSSNRLISTELGQREEFYAYDADGNMARMPHLPEMEWDFKDQLHGTLRQRTKTGRGETTYYVYNSEGQRVRKVTEGASGTRFDERIYLGSFEIYRKYDSLRAVTAERETLHVMDKKRRLALIETKTFGESRPIPEVEPRVRYQFENHLGSSVLELDDQASIITYEEYYPYGNTSYQAAECAREVTRKRYRYIGKECDEETGFYQLGVRYYAPWLARWTAADPAGGVDGTNLYQFARLNPVRYMDPDGTQSQPKVEPLREGMIIGDYPGLSSRAQSAVEGVLENEYHGGSFARNMSLFKADMASLPRGSNTQEGSAIFKARKLYNAARKAFGKSVTLPEGTEIHHALPGQELSQNPEAALDLSHWEITNGKAAVRSTSHWRAHRANELLNQGVENPGVQATQEMQAARDAANSAARPAPPPESAPASPPTPPEAPAPSPTPGEGGGSVANAAESVAKPSTLGKLAKGGLKIGAGIVINIVTTKVAVHILRGNKFQKEQDVLNQANHAAESPDDTKRKETEETLLGWMPGPIGTNILFAGFARLVMDRAYDMVEEDRERKVQQFHEQNPDAPPEMFDQMEKMQDDFYNGLTQW